MNITLVPPEYVLNEWSRVRDHLEPAVDRCKGRWTMEHLCGACCGGRAQLWMAFDQEEVYGALTTEITHYPARKVLSMHFIGGRDFDLWYPEMLEVISRYAKDNDCDGLEGVARFGFWKYLQHNGFEKNSAFYEKGFH